MAAYTTERVLDVQHWSDRLFSFRTTRGAGLRFENGQFLMLGLEIDGRRIVRAYSIASANYEEHLEFYSIKVPGGPLTSRLQHIERDSSLLVSSKPTGTLVLRDLKPGRRLIMLATGTGVAPFVSIAKDPETYERFEQVILLRGARVNADLAYGDAVIRRLREDADLGDTVRARLLDYPTVTRDTSRYRGRVTTNIASGQVFSDLGVGPLDPECDRLMICGNMRMLADAQALLESRGFEPSPQVGVAGDYLVERAFVESLDTAAPRREPAIGGGGLGRRGTGRHRPGLRNQGMRGIEIRHEVGQCLPGGGRGGRATGSRLGTRAQQQCLADPRR
jgi:ferredoxin/flavodoxin---NADP+ reductase